MDSNALTSVKRGAALHGQKPLILDDKTSTGNAEPQSFSKAAWKKLINNVIRERNRETLLNSIKNSQEN